MSDRSRRRCVLRKAAVPDATHYVGYVEDEETPEMIMKKFEEMERIKAAAAADARPSGALEGPAAADAAVKPAAAAAEPECAGDGALDQEQLQAIFKATSMYNVKSLLGNNAALMVEPRGGRDAQLQRGAASDGACLSGGEDELLAELRGFWSDDDWGGSAATKKKGKRARGAAAAGAPGGKARRGLQRNQRTCIIAQYNRDTHAFIRRRARAVDPDAILQLRLPPPPLPLSWGKPVRPFSQQQQQQPAAAAAAGAPRLRALGLRGLLRQPPALPASRNCDPASAAALPPGAPLPPDACEVHMTPSLSSFAFSSLRVQQYQAVLVNSGWEAPQQQPQLPQQQPQGQPLPPGQQAGPGGGVTARLAALPIPRLCPRGFIMIWASKEHLSAVVGLMSSWGFSYVENLTWVLMAPNNTMLALPYATARRSHLTLYIFRKDGEGRDIELRHQRNPDVVFDCVRSVEGRPWDVPAAVFDSIETLLPTGKGAFLELWAAVGAGRAGWTHIAEAPQAHSATPLQQQQQQQQAGVES